MIIYLPNLQDFLIKNLLQVLFINIWKYINFFKIFKKNNLALFGYINLLIFFILITGDRTPLLLVLLQYFYFYNQSGI